MIVFYVFARCDICGVAAPPVGGASAQVQRARAQAKRIRWAVRIENKPGIQDLCPKCLIAQNLTPNAPSKDS